ncbi:MAG TPA: YbaL family putative K(+) efflux transporter [Dongiaceae bacterium]
MDHSSGLVTTIVGALVLAFVLGTLAHRLRVSPLVGYLLAGVLVGPFTPGFVADQHLADELAEIGVVLLMFGVGLHFSLKDLLAVKAIAVPGAILQMSFGTLLGLGLARMLGWSLASGLVFGLALSVASTVVTLRALQERRLIETERGRIAVGWLVVEDFAMVLALVLLPAFAGLLGLGHEAGGGDQMTPSGVVDLPDILLTVGITLGKIVAFVALMLVVGRRVIPWLLHYVVHTGSRELFRLGVLVIALGVAYGAAALFGVSFALGAFFAGMVLSESPLSQQAAAESLPLRDAFAVLFFVSVGMLFDPRILLADPWPIFATFLIVTVGKSLPPFAIAMIFRRPMSTAITMAASLAQIGEFSFILASLGVELHLLDEKARDFILAGAILSIMVNPFLFAGLDCLLPWFERREKKAAMPAGEPAATRVELPVTQLTGHAVLIGYGRVGSLVGDALQKAGRPLLVIEDRPEIVSALKAKGVEVMAGNAASPALARAANMVKARWLVVAIPNAFEAGEIVEQARAANPTLEILARAHSDAEIDYLKGFGADFIIMGEREIALAMIGHLLGPPASEPQTVFIPPAP